MTKNSKEINKELVAGWVEEYGDTLYSWACYRISNEDIAKDLIQDTFLAAWQSVENFKRESNPKTWLFSILNNKVIDYYRKSASSIQHQNAEVQDAIHLTESFFREYGDWSDRRLNPPWDRGPELLDDPEFNLVMVRCMDDLPVNWRGIVTAKYLLEKESKEICQELELSPSNYWQIMHRAKLLLKKCLELNWFKE